MRSNQSILKEINPEYSLEGLMLKLKLQYSGHLMRRTDSLEKTLMLGKIEGRRRRGPQRMRQFDGIIDSMDMILSKLWRQWRTGKAGVLQSMGLQRVRHDWATEDWALKSDKREKTVSWLNPYPLGFQVLVNYGTQVDATAYLNWRNNSILLIIIHIPFPLGSQCFWTTMNISITQSYVISILRLLLKRKKKMYCWLWLLGTKEQSGEDKLNCIIIIIK